MEKKKDKSGGFSGQIGFVLAAAGSAVGVGNLWRFPYLVAQDGGGLFLIIYLILVVTFGFTLLTTDIAIGRKTGKSSIHAYTAISPKWKFLGVLTYIVPAIIMTYYAVIGGWITKYVVVYLTGDSAAAAEDVYFTNFITDPRSIIYGLIFMLLTAFIVYNGVQSGIERFSKIVMPVLLIMVIGIAIYSLTLRHETEDGLVRTGIDGFKFYVIPDLTGITVSKFLKICLDAMNQLFFSLSVAMGIMITYGSYVKKDINLNQSVAQIEIFDTGVAVLAGMMIIPSVFVFSRTILTEHLLSNKSGFKSCPQTCSKSRFSELFHR
ncbi:MAG: sodium-dependent transporter, partial [Huintestinicola sp.]